MGKAIGRRYPVAVGALVVAIHMKLPSYVEPEARAKAIAVQEAVFKA